MGRLLAAAIEQARRINPDTLTNPAQSLEQYYAFLTFAERAIPGSLLTPPPGATLYQRIDQGLAYLYYIADLPLPELEGRGYFNNSLQYTPAYGAWMRGFVRSWGRFLDTPDSWTPEYLELAQADGAFGLAQGWYEAPGRWQSFNDFFTRRLQDPGARPIAAAADPSVVASPVDGIPQGLWAVDSASVVVPAGLPLKSGTVQGVDALLGADSEFRDAFAGGTFTHLFLDVGDYHHYHFPLGGTVREVAIIPGQEAAGGYIRWDSAGRRYAFDASSTGWQSLETRGRLILETPEFGLVALMPIGMSPVSSVSFESGLQPGTRVAKGDLMGHFRFGGSDFVMIFQRQVTVRLAPPGDATGRLPHLLMGQELARLARRAVRAR